MSRGVQDDLILDLGVNHGEDARFYLDKGFRVVGVEADPKLAEALRAQFADEIAMRRFVLAPVGIMDGPGERLFYRNLANDRWSSFDPAYGCRNGAPFEAVNIHCVDLQDLIEKQGCPYYLKVDVKGADQLVLRQLKSIPLRPTFLSVGEFDIDTIDYLFSLGYNMFSLRPQLDKSWARLPDPPREGKFVSRTFTELHSGPFGRETPEWMSVSSARRALRDIVRRKAYGELQPPGECFDLHATHWPRKIDDRSLDLIDEGRCA